MLFLLEDQGWKLEEKTIKIATAVISTKRKRMEKTHQ